MSDPLGVQLRRHRLMADLTLEGLANASGISDRTISNIERGISVAPQRRTLTALLDALGLPDHEQQAMLRLARLPRIATEGSPRSAMLAPALVTDFTGRPDVLRDVAAFLDRTDTDLAAPILVICGPAGVGKTTLALEALSRHEWDDGTRAFVDLNGMNSLPLSPLGVLQSLIAQTSEIRDISTLDEAIAEWRRITGGRRVAVVLDNAANEDQVRPVLAATNIVVIVTSRRSLAGLVNVRRITLEPLERAESVQLIGRIVPASQRTDADADALAVACGDLPLALRIAANRVAAQPRSTVRDFLDTMAARRDPLRALVAGDLAVEPALTLSYGHTDAASQQLFRSLALIDGATFDAHLAAAAAGADVDETAERLDELTDLGLVEARGGNRYHLHDLVRLFAAALSRRDESSSERQRRALRHWVLTTAQNAGLWFEPDRAPDPEAPGRHFASADDARAWLRIEGPQWASAVTQAYALGEDQLVLDVAEALHWFSDTWPAWDLWRILFLTSADAATRSGTDRDIAVHHGYATWLHLTQGEFDAALRSARSAVAAAERTQDDKERGWASFYLAWTLGRLLDHDAALREASRAMQHLTLAGDQEGITQVLAMVANFLMHTGDLAGAVEHYEQVLSLLERRSGSLPPNLVLVTGVHTRTLLAKVLNRDGQPAYALEVMPGVIAEATAAQFADGVSRAHLELANALHLTGELDDARHHLAVADEIATEHRLLALFAEIEKLRSGLGIPGSP
ncbi:helix-turn-helix domain-containing protein [Curtobacterium sp. SORGH_AS_0776]|uniref:helix-turn-helix domain-containing protein n=1 Tax=Curtobacterium sp. SORGH_AS_0776 TaxID=3041798 RepID=UPI0028558A6B|nr:helix-turn-helix domain-containing protein [Curtobacterium sp. SORGH_AS_0776]MDR6170498.1 transcriptional regulator with XRE-family HTH domain/tetratricopeptide (TPR) repeat protein [Curtobacterium sp. SORGH_AS_0776]